MAIGALSLLLSAMVSSGCLGTASVSVTSPVLAGFQSTDPLVRPIAATRTSSVTSSPSDVFSVTVVRYSRGSVLSIVNGTRTALPTTPNVGAPRLTSSTSGNRVVLPTGTENTGTPFNRSFVAAWTGGGPSFQSPSEISTMPIRFFTFSGACASGSYRSVRRPASGAENGCTTTSIRSRSDVHAASSIHSAIAS